ncbi:hypothetical protein J5N97_001039 [Dioscorea zingiberensis]|uniref:PRP1 splicing factor N-terminal domain-containing protein n=1 Tax=Dioscorea zingiberensis TaxID=325984 RepID=A0A9D5BU88_9LILI|nr:hypothetical protein J5N97_001039 [Dioscorea zingiberensis]
MFVRLPSYKSLKSKPPPNYVAGVGRGATGFTTRSDIGPGIYSIAALGVHKDDEDDEDDLRENFDEFEGYHDMGLFSSAEYDDKDLEADAVWESVDEYMASRRKDRKEKLAKLEMDKYLASNPIINQQFLHLKRDLKNMTPEQWDSIPEVGNYSRRNKRKRFKSFVPVPDTLLERARQERALLASLDPKSLAAGGTETPATDLTAVGKGRGTLLSLTLDQFSVRNFTSIDTEAYLAGLNSTKILSDADISDIKKARLLMKSLTQSRPEYPRGWISAARLEEVAGDIKAARRLIQRGYHKCPKNEDVWLEVCRLARPDEAKALIAKGVKANPNSVKLWLQAAKLKHEQQNQIRVLMKALQRVPTSVRLWKAIVELANEEDARILLQRAVECCPLHVELWLALARLEISYEQAKKVLNKAREKLPKEPSIWITAAKLEEAANGNTESVGKVIDRGKRSLQGEGVEIDRDVWMKEAEVAERVGSIVTCQTIIKNTIGVGVEEEDRKRTWVADAEECKKRGSIETALAIYAHAQTVFLTKKSIWLKAAELKKSMGYGSLLMPLLRNAVTS